MATEQAHIELANRTQQTIQLLLSDRDVHSPWIATAGFYKALHIVEAVFANDHSIQHTNDHKERASRLKAIRKYDHIAKNYFPLARASLVARYLTPHRKFDTYPSPNDVVEKLLKHYLRQVEKSAERFLSSPGDLVSVQSLFPHA